jgi:hypothetical protein
MIVHRADATPHSLLDPLDLTSEPYCTVSQNYVIHSLDKRVRFRQPINDEDTASVLWKVHSIIAVHKDYQAHVTSPQP